MKKEVENRLVIEVAKGLQLVIVRFDTSIIAKSMDWAAAIAQWLPEDVTQKCVRFCGGSGFYTFITDEINRRITQFYKLDAKSGNKRLVDIPEFQDAVSIAHEIVHVLSGLPNRHRISVGLPLSFSRNAIGHVENFQLSSEISICSSEHLPKPFPLTSPNDNIEHTMWDDFVFSEEYETEINKDRIYFTSTALGYSGDSGSSILARDFEDSLRAFYGAGLALGLFSYEYVSSEKEPPIVLHHEEANNRSLIKFKVLEADLWSNKEYLSTKKTASNKSSDIFIFGLKSIKQIFNREVTSKRLFTAAIWFFRAEFSQRPLDKLLEATIAIEVILGDRDVADGIGLTKLLGNRCAYMLGKTNAEREAIQQTFVSLYRLRSSIVHSGKHRADRAESKIVDDATALCGRIIAHELIALLREEERTTALRGVD